MKLEKKMRENWNLEIRPLLLLKMFNYAKQTFIHY